MSNTSGRADMNSIAVIGMSCRFPGSNNVAEFWRNIAAGIEPIIDLSTEDLIAVGIEAATIEKPNYVKRCSRLDRVEYFDAAFFEMTAREAAMTSPSQRLLLKCAYEALEDGCVHTKDYDGHIGVFVGANRCDEWQKRLYELARGEEGDSAKQLQLYIANDLDYAATRVSFKLNLKGPSLNISTACSTSLVAVHMACRSLLSYECDMALAGGASVVLPQDVGYLYEEGGIRSSDGRCRAFDARSDGTIFGNGVGVVLLKRLEEALADHDNIQAIIRGSAINNDGSSKVGYTAPSVTGQAAVISTALAVAEVSPDEISYVEAHGTGTSLGDPIEVEALSKAYRAQTHKKSYCALGSVKTNIGHLGAAAGVAGLIKTIQALKQQKIPPSLHFGQPNPEIDFHNSPFFVNTKLRPWQQHAVPRRAAVSSFGVGGTNAHVVLEEAPILSRASASRKAQLLVLSAKSENALRNLARALSDTLANEPALDLANVAYSMNTGRERFPFRSTLVASNTSDAIQKLTCDVAAFPVATNTAAQRTKIAFMFPGQGAQYVNMGHGLYHSENVFRDCIDQCAELLQQQLGCDLRTILYSSLTGEGANSLLKQTRIAQPALFVIEYALARLWQSWGIHPDAMIGHSIGEYVAGCLAGVMSLEHALFLVAERGRLMQLMPSGLMLAISMPEADLLPFLDECELAAVNAPDWCVASGPEAAIQRLEKLLTSREINCRRLHTSHAFHSAMMDPILEDFFKAVKSIELHAPAIPFMSNLSGDWIRHEQAVDSMYWVRHLRSTVRFYAGANRLLNESGSVLLEVGPGQTLTNLVKTFQPTANTCRVESSCRQAKQQHDDLEIALETLGHLWAAGININWQDFYAKEQRYRISLPTYPFEEQRHWLEQINRPANFDSETPASYAMTGSDTRPQQSLPSARGLRARVADCPADQRAPLFKEYVQRRVGALLGTTMLDEDTALIELGMSSLSAIELRTQINNELEFDCISVVALMDENATINNLATFIQATVAGLAPQKPQTNAVTTQHQTQDLALTTTASDPTDTPTSTADQPALAIKPDPDHAFEPFPLTDIQQAYWIGRHSTSGGKGVATYAYIETEFHGLDLERYEKALNELVQRHHMLRMIVRDDGSQQFLRSVPYYKIGYEDLRDCSEGERQRRLGELRERMSHQVLDPSVWPLFEMRVNRVTDDVYRMHYGFDFMIVDVLSLLVFFRDMFLVYIGESKRLTPLEINFRDYVLIEKRGHESEHYEKSKRYWLGRVGTLPAAPSLPFNKDPTQIVAPRYVRRDFEIDSDTWGRLKETARRHKITSSVLIANAFSEVLAQWCSTPKFTLNLTIFNRPALHPQMNDLIGDFTSSVLLEVDMSQRSSFDQSAKKIQTQLLNDLEHRYFNGVEVLRAMNSQLGGYQAAIMPIVLTSALGLDQHAEGKLAGLSVDQLQIYEQMMTLGHTISQTSQVWLDHVVREKNGALLCNWDALEELFPDKLLDDMFCAYYDRLIQLANDGDDVWRSARPARLPTYQQRQRDMVNRTAAPISEALLQSLFQQMAEEKPDNIAIINRGITISYRDLHVLASQLAADLRQRGVKPNQLVAIVMDKGWEQIAAVFAILFSGGAYMPVDAALPKQRIRHLLLQSDVTIAFTQPHLADTIEWPAQVLPIMIEKRPLEDNRRTLVQPIEIPAVQLSTDLAYVLFTSGSTGVPKGVMIDHRSAVNTVLDINSRFQITEHDRVLAINALNFDLSVYDVFGFLAIGGALIIPDYERALDPKHWVELVTKEGVTLWNTVPAIVQLYVEELEHETDLRAQGIRWVFMSGDRIPVSLPDRIRQVIPGAQPISLGGPTETTVWSIYYPITHVDPNWKSIPYGKPLANRTHQILHADLTPCPDWVAGDIYTGGQIGLSRGYWKDEEKTKQAFIVHPQSGEQLYRTGDVGRFLPNGNIEFIGRLDNQIKIQGHRIELGEIEFALRHCEGVQDAIAMVVRDETATKNNSRLVGYVVEQDYTQEDQPFVDAIKATNCILDPVERAAFKLRHVGIRPVDAHSIVVDLPNKPARERLLSLRSVGLDGLASNTLAAHSNSATSLENLGLWLSCIGQIQLPGYSLPKYYYPSAGSGHPIQLYLHLNTSSVKNVIAGFYYYDPVEHRLILIEETPNSQSTLVPSGLKDTQFKVFFVSYDAAIVPLYGEATGKSFAEIEAGHMHCLLSAAAPIANIGFAALDITDTDSLPNAWIFNRDYRVIHCLTAAAIHPDNTSAYPSHADITVDCMARQSYRKFSSRQVSPDSLKHLLSCWSTGSRSAVEYDVDLPEVYLYVKPTRAEDLTAGFYRFDIDRAELVKICEVQQGLSESLQFLDNRRIHNRSAFSLLFIGRKTSARFNNLLSSGYLAQTLINCSTKWGIGLCSLGGAKLEVVRNYLPLDDDQQVLYCLEGGAVEIEQTRQWVTESMHLDAEDDWKSTLRNQLPYYMIPSHFIRLKGFPLTANGKVDREALKALTQTTETKERTLIAPRDDIERMLLNIWRDVLSIESLSVEDNLFELGGDSLSATKLISDAGKLLGANLPLHKLFTNPTIAGMAESYRSLLTQQNAGAVTTSSTGSVKAAELLTGFGTMVSILEKDAKLDPSIVTCLSTPPPIENPKNIFLTGATGFLGAYVLKELLDNTTAMVHCLARRTKLASARNRIESNLRRYGLWKNIYSTRIAAVEGDLSVVKFGLDDNAYKTLCGAIDVIYHLGAQVNYARAYQDLMKTNVLGAESMIRFACTSKLKAINFVSTKYVCFGLSAQGVNIHRDETSVPDASGVFVGYTQSKWVAEKLFEQAQQRGVPVSIFRPGQISGAISSDAVLPDDAFHHLIKLFISMSSIPDENDWKGGVIDVVPVDFAARALVKIGLKPCSYSKHYNLVNPNPMPVNHFFHLLHKWREGAGTASETEVVTKPFKSWADDCMACINNMNDPAAAHVLGKFFVETEHGHFIKGLFMDGELSVNNVDTGLLGSDVACPHVDIPMWHHYLTKLIGVQEMDREEIELQA